MATARVRARVDARREVARHWNASVLRVRSLVTAAATLGRVCRFLWVVFRRHTVAGQWIRFAWPARHDATAKLFLRAILVRRVPDDVDTIERAHARARASTLPLFTSMTYLKRGHAQQGVSVTEPPEPCSNPPPESKSLHAGMSNTVPLPLDSSLDASPPVSQSAVSISA